MKPEDENLLDMAWKLDATDTGIEIFFRWRPLENLPETPKHLVIREQKADKLKC